MKKIIFSLCLLLAMKAGYSTVMFTTQYNSTLDVFEVYVTSTVSYANFQQGPSTVSILFEAGYDISTATVITSSNGGPWVAQDKGTITVVGPLNGYKFVNFLSNGSAYPIVPVGSPVKLFSFSFGAGANCAGGFKQRHVVNGSDPLDPDGLGTYDITAFLFSPSTGQLNSSNTDLTFLNCAALSPLPVTLLNFSATKKNNDAVLNWQVQNQDANSAYFELEKGFTGSDFIKIGRVEVDITTGPTATYSFNDANFALTKSNGIVFYRLKMVDKDGKYTYSLIRSLKLTAKAFGVNLYPNPAKGFTNVTIELENNSQLNLSISDGAGRVVHNMQFTGLKGLNQKRIDLSKLAGGSYMMKVNNGTEVQTVPLIKQ